MKRSLLAALPVMLLSVSCAETSPDDEPAASVASALSAAQCEFFEVGGKVTICHATGGPGSPVKQIRIASAACQNAHADHPGDFIAVSGSCGPGTCLAELTPCDQTLPCCDGLTCDQGLCVQPSICAVEDFESFGCDTIIAQDTPIFGGLATMEKVVGSSPLAVYLQGSEDCEFSFGPCSTLNVDASHSMLVATDNVYATSFRFARAMRSFSIGKLYGLGTVQIQFLKAGSVVLTDVIDRNPEVNVAVDCTIGSSGSWTPASDFDEVVISGGILGLTDLGACTM